MKSTLNRLWDEKPLQLILFAGAFFRLLAVIFSKGYGMHDDHFLVVEAAQSWVDGKDYNNWLPTFTRSVTEPTGHSLLYPGLHYFLFQFLEFTGIFDPQIKMFVVRLLHAALSLTIVSMGYDIALRAGGQKAARTAGLLLALLFFMPMMSVRNLVEFVCIPPLMYATWLVFKNDEEKKWMPVFSAGLLLGIACSIRFQTIFFSTGFGLVLLLQKKWRDTFLLGLGMIVSLLFVQMATDMIIWHKPFQEMMAYVRYNMANATTYGTQKWYNYILLLSGILIPPVSLFLIYGYLKSSKKHLLLFLPAFLFFVLHSSFPNKQERFILPVIPFIIILGAIGWESHVTTSNFWKERKKLLKACWIFFWCLNTIPLFVVSTAYSHRSRVEAMVYLSRQPDMRNFIVEESNHDYSTQAPLFYLRKWVSPWELTSIYTVDSVSSKLKTVPPGLRPNYVIFNQADNIEQRVAAFRKTFPSLRYMTTIHPGFVDVVMHRLNWHNANFTSYIYRFDP